MQQEHPFTCTAQQHWHHSLRRWHPCRAVNDPLQVRSTLHARHALDVAALAVLLPGALPILGWTSTPGMAWWFTFMLPALMQDAMYETWAAGEVDDWDTQEYSDEQLIGILYNVCGPPLHVYHIVGALHASKVLGLWLQGPCRYCLKVHRDT